ncbi:valine--tRNA ligase, mitochondrial [Corythoichthys intestinalis]|uniref:valine--tRNA ligase, mitochondrial n=1 Tax=Corythoichthys intestinalis TaxID=161448 RepID=UPI0025A54F67|nr:valine--tRNA ligase, mitochondrial [Corythoichthys intestinalis]XP_057683517.1 valine--tRNA ligase, mitochondrial [Corythoichthys intestinalis]XP_061808316.1 valine--tRNA ligase, mitochondrial-like [Nerophis lumbriciformis]
MWRLSPLLRLPRGPSARLCSSKPSERPASKSTCPSRLQSEKQRRKKQREKAILSPQYTTAEEDILKWSEKERILYTAHTPPGAKKDTNLPFPSAYSPDFVESAWYQWWEKEGFFSPEHHDVQKSSHAVDQNFSLCIPPPNVTGTLHLGHALTVAIEDALVRWKRMRGHRVLWVPGCDHAGIATQSVVERMLLREQGKHRQDLTREEFLQEAWKWKNLKGDEIYQQLRKLGASLDWSRACFTMDKNFSEAVTEAFVRLCDAGLIYRSEGLVNWSCALESAISDIEVDSKELSGKTMLSVPGYEEKVEFGTMLTFAYPIDGHGGEIMVSTTRPETMLGDVAVAVHPDDPRYLDFHGKKCRHPFNDRLLPIVTDETVDVELGTGAVKVTPAHDRNDFLLSQRHALPCVTVIGGDGKMTSFCGQWLEGVKRFDARRLVVDALVEKKLFRGKKEHAMTLPICSRSGDVIEPLLKKQWFVRCQGMAQKAIQAVEDGQLEIIPHFYSKTWKNWLSNVSDWCISRQLWWGHQIPAYRVDFPHSADDRREERWVWGMNEDEARRRASLKYGVKPQDVILTRDSDVLDTWFSSALFPFAMLGWPQQTKDFQRFYPNSILETGSDLLFFWVARMVMLGTELTGKLPFKQVLLHSLVRDKHGRKMSKSLGNVIDPLDVTNGVSLEMLQRKIKEGNLDPREQTVATEAQRKDFPNGIPQCGTDALRFALCSHKMTGEDISLSVSQVLSCRHFCNKIWQTLRFTLGVLGDNTTPMGTLEETSDLSSMDGWICSRLYRTVAQVEKAFEEYELHTVTAALYSFWVHNLCDVYMESVKPVLLQQNQGTPSGGKARATASVVLYHCVSVSLALLSPIMPFLTEELWQRLQPFRPESQAQKSLCLQPYPRSSQLKHWHFPEEEEAFLLVQEVIRVARSLRAQCGLTKEKPEMWAVCSPNQSQILLHFGSAVWTLSRVSRINIHCPEAPLSTAPPEGCLVGVVDHTCQLHLPLQSAVKIDKQIAQLTRRKSKLVSKLNESLSKIQSPDFPTKVPAHIRQQMESKTSAFRAELKTIEDQLKALQMTATPTSDSNNELDQCRTHSS